MKIQCNSCGLEGDFKYLISITKPSSDGYKYSVLCMKLFGDCYSGMTTVNSNDELEEVINSYLQDWERYDSILGRNPDKPDRYNTHICSFTKEVKGVFSKFGFEKIVYHNIVQKKTGGVLICGLRNIDRELLMRL